MYTAVQHRTYLSTCKTTRYLFPGYSVVEAVTRFSVFAKHNPVTREFKYLSGVMRSNRNSITLVAVVSEVPFALWS